jgi:dihydrofolate reductase
VKSKIKIVVAMSSNRVIGKDNQLPWHLPEDLQHFKSTTLGHTMIMGRKTFESIGRTLPGRTTIVVTRNPKWQFNGVQTASSLEQAIAMGQEQSPDSNLATTIFIVGGSEIYQQALTFADCVIATEIELSIDGDAHFPTLEPTSWLLASSEKFTSKTGLRFRINNYTRQTTL